MSDLTDFLLARIAEDEAYALDVNPDARAEALDGITSEHYETWRFLLEQTPARVLAECEAKRRVVREVEETLKSAAFVPGGTGRLIVESGVRAILRHLAAVYSAHPAYRDEWRYLT